MNAMDAASVHTAALAVDESDSFFFDHPVDHVPGMLLLDGLLSLAERAASRAEPVAGVHYVSALELNFERFCEKAPAARLEAVVGPIQDGCRRCEIKALQDDVVVCRGFVEFVGSSPMMIGQPGAADQSRLEPAPREGVHKLHGENIFISGLHSPSAGDAYQARLLPLSPSHCLYVRQQDQRTPLELVEACRQFCLLLQHKVHAAPAGWPFIFVSVSARFRRACSRGTRLHITTASDVASAAAGNAMHRIELFEDDAAVGQLALNGRVVSPRIYGRMRQAHRPRLAVR